MLPPASMSLLSLSRPPTRPAQRREDSADQIRPGVSQADRQTDQATVMEQGKSTGERAASRPEVTKAEANERED
jgi:hypothetical protein